MIIYFLAILAGIAKSVADLSSESAFYKSKLVRLFKFDPSWWHRSQASGNKWLNGDKSQGERFFGSSRWFVWLTDGWHLTNSIMYISLLLVGYLASDLLMSFVGLIIFLSTFELLYNWLKK